MTSHVLTDAEVALAALSSLTALTPRQLRLALAKVDPCTLWADISSGSSMNLSMIAPGQHEDAAREATAFDVDKLRATLTQLSIRVLATHSADTPDRLRDDESRPPAIFLRGDQSLLTQRMVAIVGTRRATAAGRATATELAEQLSAAGVIVVSGLALGIDTAAHRGAMSQGSTVAVVECGLDRCYPTRHQELFDEMCEHHLVLSEWPPGISPAPYRFPMRNRLIAALAELLIVVESDSTGGSLITAREALDRGREVMAVPGSPRVATSRGTNALIRDGATPVTCVDDVIQVLGITHISVQQTSPVAGLHETSIEIVHLLKGEALTLGQIVDRLSMPIGETVIVMSELVQRKIISETNGWFELAGSMLVSGEEP